jgi:hypothetical protein
VTFESTLPIGEPELMRVSAFRRYLDDLDRESEMGGSRLSSLNPSLWQDLARFEHDHGGRSLELVEVLAASVRHARSLAIHVQCDDKVVTLTVFPTERLCHCPIPMRDFLGRRLDALEVLHVEPAVLKPPGDPERSLVGEPHLYHPLGPVTWALALHGARDALLPEIAGAAAYRVAPGVNLGDLPLAGSLEAAVRRLQRQTTNLRDLSEWPGFDRSRAMRLLNALYLQAGLIVSRSHPAATRTHPRS